MTEKFVSEHDRPEEEAVYKLCKHNAKSSLTSAGFGLSTVR